ncbi:MAG: hypothetical protein ACPG7G_05655, partial [Acidimicrobiales bacterium]
PIPADRIASSAPHRSPAMMRSSRNAGGDSSASGPAAPGPTGIDGRGMSAATSSSSPASSAAGDSGPDPRTDCSSPLSSNIGSPALSLTQAAMRRGILIQSAIR